MIDLSNNNESVDFHRLYHAGQRRVYLKRSEGASYTDPTFDKRYNDALHVGFRVGAYHFARPSQHTPQEEAAHFLRLLPKLTPGKTLRPCLDLEDPNAAPDSHIGRWAQEWLVLVRNHVKYHPIIYGSPYYLEACNFKHIPGWLWVASYGRNNGREYPFVVPKPWHHSQVLAHQFASNARVPGCVGPVDISQVFRPRLLGVNRLHFR